MTCQMYRIPAEEFCRRKGSWRPANIPMMSHEWFCKQHAKQIAEQQGTWGIYHRDRQTTDDVEELP